MIDLCSVMAQRLLVSQYRNEGRTAQEICVLPLGKLYTEEVLELVTSLAPALLKSCAERKMLCLRQALSLGAKTLFLCFKVYLNNKLCFRSDIIN